MIGRLLSVDQVAEVVGLSPKGVRSAIRRGELAASKLAGRLRVREQDVERWIEGSRVQPQAPALPEPQRAVVRGGLRQVLEQRG